MDQTCLQLPARTACGGTGRHHHRPGSKDGHHNHHVDKDDVDHADNDDKDIDKDDATAAYIDHGEVLAVLGVHLGVAGLEDGKLADVVVDTFLAGRRALQQPGTGG